MGESCVSCGFLDRDAVQNSYYAVQQYQDRKQNGEYRGSPQTRDFGRTEL